MRTMLVVPGEPSGTPATMMTPSPALANPSSKAMRRALRTMAAWFSGSLVRTQCTPQAIASLRPVATTGDPAKVTAALQRAIDHNTQDQTRARRTLAESRFSWDAIARQYCEFFNHIYRVTTVPH